MIKKSLALLLVLGCFLCLVPSVAAAKVFQGRVTLVEWAPVLRHKIQVRALEGGTMTFWTTLKTKFVPNRLPDVGELVRVRYAWEDGKRVIRKVTVLPYLPPPGTATPPGPPSPVVKKPDILLQGKLTVMKPRINIRSGPGTGYTVIGRATQGQVLMLRGQSRAWYYVFLPEKHRFGWIYSKLVRVDHVQAPPSKGNGTQPLPGSRTF